MKVSVLYNPNAANGTGKEKAEAVRPFFQDEEVEFQDMTKISYPEFFAALEPDEKVVLCGGDGTVNRFVNDTENIPFSNSVYLFPAGTGNDFLNDLGKKAEDGPVCIDAYIKDLPVAEVKGKKYRVLNGIGYGIDGYCCEVADQIKEKDPGAEINYTSIAIKGLLFHYKPTNAVVTVDGVRHEFKKVWLCPCMNGRFYGGGMMAAPGQDRLNPEGTLTVMLYQGAGRIRTLIAFPAIFKGEHVKKKMVHLFTGKEVKVEFSSPTALQIDGETILGVTEYTMRSGKLSPKKEAVKAEA